MLSLPAAIIGTIVGSVFGALIGYARLSDPVAPTAHELLFMVGLGFVGGLVIAGKLVDLLRGKGASL